MGRQICFFASKSDLIDFFSFLSANNGVVINENGTELKKDELENIQDREFIKGRYDFPDMYVKHKDSSILFNHYTKLLPHRICLDSFKSEVIQFSVPQHFPKMSESEYDIQIGRFHVETETYSNCQKIKELYNQIVKYIKKNYMISENKLAYIGREAYKWYKEGKLIPKSLCYTFSFL